jgi:cytoskeletal protein CcmA (bactofilin family)
VTGHLLTIARRGNVRASVRAGEIDVLGSLHGKVEGAEKMYIRNGARVVADIQVRGDRLIWLAPELFHNEIWSGDQG